MAIPFANLLAGWIGILGLLLTGPTGCRTMVSDVTLDRDSSSDHDNLPSDAGDLEECDDLENFDPSGCQGEPPFPCVFYVDDSAEQGGAGTAWSSALGAVQQGIDRAYCALLAGRTTCQVWVKNGTYQVNGGCRWETLRLRPGVEVYGGFGGGEASLLERDWSVNETIFKGDGTGEERVNTVIVGAHGAVLDGIVVEGGFFQEETEKGGACGGGLFVEKAEMKVQNSTFRGNQSRTRGGGVCALGSVIVFENCIFEDNEASSGGGLFAEQSTVKLKSCRFESNGATLSGAGVSTFGASGDLQISDCSFRHNSARDNSGGVKSEKGALLIEKSVFSRNSASRSGGAVGHTLGELVIRESLFERNESVSGEGGAVFSRLVSGFSLVNSVFWGNAAGKSGGAVMHREGGAVLIVNNTFVSNDSGVGAGAVSLDYLSGTSEIFNSVLWANTTPSISDTGGTLYNSGHNYIDDGPDGGGDGGASHPRFRDEDAGDFRLLSGSPCIDRADGKRAPVTDFLGQPRVDDPDTPNRGTGPKAFVDIGAFEYQAAAR